MATETKYLKAAESAASWFLTTQVPESPNKGDANAGRYLFHYHLGLNAAGMSGNWCSAIGCMSLLAMHRHTGNARYLDSAKRAGEYIKSLQILDRDHKHFGAFREWTPQSLWCFPRDTNTAGWAMLCLHRATSEREYLRRAELLAHWHMNRTRHTSGLARGWPRNQVALEGEQRSRKDSLGNFQAGAGLFFYNLYRTTKNPLYVSKGLKPLLEFFTTKFYKGDGAFWGRYDLDAKQWAESDHGHKYNDDFAGLSILAAYKATGEREYLTIAHAYAEWIIAHMTADGGFDDMRNTSSAAMCCMYLCELGRLARTTRYQAAARRMGDYLIAWQCSDPRNLKKHGAMYGENNLKEYVGTRETAYAIGAWLKLEGRKDDLIYSIRGW